MADPPTVAFRIWEGGKRISIVRGNMTHILEGGDPIIQDDAFSDIVQDSTIASIHGSELYDHAQWRMIANGIGRTMTRVLWNVDSYVDSATMKDLVDAVADKTNAGELQISVMEESNVIVFSVLDEEAVVFALTLQLEGGASPPEIQLWKTFRLFSNAFDVKDLDMRSLYDNAQYHLLTRALDKSNDSCGNLRNLKKLTLYSHKELPNKVFQEICDAVVDNKVELESLIFNMTVENTTPQTERYKSLIKVLQGTKSLRHFRVLEWTGNPRRDPKSADETIVNILEDRDACKLESLDLGTNWRWKNRELYFRYTMAVLRNSKMLENFETSQGALQPPKSLVRTIVQLRNTLEKRDAFLPEKKVVRRVERIKSAETFRLSLVYQFFRNSPGLLNNLKAQHPSSKRGRVDHDVTTHKRRNVSCAKSLQKNSH